MPLPSPAAAAATVLAVSRAAEFAAVYALLTGSHELADHWVQIDAHATVKGQPGAAGARACAIHVATYTATQAAALYAGHRLLGLRLTPARAAAALAVSAITHYAADRQGGHWRDPHPRGIVRLAAATGHKRWLLRDPGAGYLMDQSWHKAWITAAALIAAGGAHRTNGPDRVRHPHRPHRPVRRPPGHRAAGRRPAADGLRLRRRDPRLGRTRPQERRPRPYRACDNVISFDLDGGTWDPGEDPDDDQRREDINDLVDARAALGPLLGRIVELEQQVAEQALTGGERMMLRFALEMADDAIESTPADFTAEDTAAVAKLRGLATGPTVAYRNPWRPGVLLCREHGEGWSGMRPLSAEDLPDGGTCTAGDPADPDDVCGRDVLARIAELCDGRTEHDGVCAICRQELHEHWVADGRRDSVTLDQAVNDLLAGDAMEDAAQQHAPEAGR